LYILPLNFFYFYLLFRQVPASSTGEKKKQALLRRSSVIYKIYSLAFLLPAPAATQPAGSSAQQ